MCWWEDDGQDNGDADVVRGGPNGELSLTNARRNWSVSLCCDGRALNATHQALKKQAIELFKRLQKGDRVWNELMTMREKMQQNLRTN